MISRLFCALLLLLFLVPFGAGQAHANTPRVVSVEPVIRDGKLDINAEIDVQLNEHLQDAAERGLALHFTADIVIRRDRWWWFNETVVDTSRTWRVAYNVLTRQWRVATDTLSWPVASLNEAMNMVRHIRNWALIDVDDLEREVAYRGQLRLRLDTSHLSRPVQLSGNHGSAWSLETQWADFSFELAKPQGQE
jgi:hypothetical protein